MHCRTTSVEVEFDPRWHKVHTAHSIDTVNRVHTRCTHCTHCVLSTHTDSAYTVISYPTRSSSTSREQRNVRSIVHSMYRAKQRTQCAQGDLIALQLQGGKEPFAIYTSLLSSWATLFVVVLNILSTCSKGIYFFIQIVY